VTSDQVDAVISGLCPLFSRYADEILDLRSSARKRVRPGMCVRCYFQLYARADAASQTVLYPLRSWLESNIEIIARDKKEQVIERLPLTLDSTDLQSYCHQLMDEFRENRVYSTEALSLEFRYKEAA
jgi:hypothetical protein